MDLPLPLPLPLSYLRGLKEELILTNCEDWEEWSLQYCGRVWSRNACGMSETTQFSKDLGTFLGFWRTSKTTTNYVLPGGGEEES